MHTYSPAIMFWSVPKQVAPDSAFNNAEASNAEPKRESTSPPSKIESNSTAPSEFKDGGEREDGAKFGQNEMGKLAKSGALSAFLETAASSRTQQLRSRTKDALRRRQQQVLEH